MPKEKVNYQEVYDLLELAFKVQKLTPDQIKVRRELRSKTGQRFMAS